MWVLRQFKKNRFKTIKININIGIFHFISYVLCFCDQTYICSIFDPNMDLAPVINSVKFK